MGHLYHGELLVITRGYPHLEECHGPSNGTALCKSLRNATNPRWLRGETANFVNFRYVPPKTSVAIHSYTIHYNSIWYMPNGIHMYVM